MQIRYKSVREDATPQVFQAIHTVSCQADSLIMEHAEPWNDSQAQLLMFHDWHYLHSALLKGFFVCFVFFPSYQNESLTNSVTGRVKSSSEVQRFEAKS